MLEFTFSDALTPRLQAAGDAHLDFTPALAAIADAMRTSTLENFAQERAPDGTPWQKSLRAVIESNKTLHDTGNLESSIAADSDATQAVFGVSSDSGAQIYAAIHNNGGTIRARAGSALNTPFGPRASVRMPQRQFLGFGPDDVVRVEEELVAHIEAAFAGGGA